MVEQAPKALDIVDYGYIMRNGRIVLDGTRKDLKENADVKEFYIGLSKFGKKKSYWEVKHHRRRKRLDVTFCNYRTYKVYKNSLVFEIKM